MKTQEQRRAPRVSFSRAAKVLHVPSLKYLPAQTCDLSQTGALVRVLAPRRFGPGDEVELFVQWGSAVLLGEGDRIKGVVRRVLASERGQVLGVEFSQRLGAAQLEAAA
jgi:hypothetical protein